MVKLPMGMGTYVERSNTNDVQEEKQSSSSSKKKIEGKKQNRERIKDAREKRKNIANLFGLHLVEFLTETLGGLWVRVTGIGVCR